ncbi:MAG: c-type cytochrome [Ilumatobacteraceae bacterium]
MDSTRAARRHRRSTRPRATVPHVVIAVVASAGVLSACLAQPDGTSADDGAVLYRSFCALCHGTDLEGTTRGPSPLSEIYGVDVLPDSAIVAAVTNGKAQQHWAFGPMPPVAGLTTPQVEAITTYLRAEQASRGLTPYTTAP